MAMQESCFSRSSHVRLAHSSIASAISHVCQTFHEQGRPNPSPDDDSKPGFFLQQELREFKKEDPTEKHQKAIPMLVISALAKQQISKLDQAIFHLIGLGMFFGFQSCKYLKVSHAKNDKQNNYAFVTFVFSRMGNLFHIHTLTSNLQIVFPSPLNAKKGRTNTTRSHRSHREIWSCAL